MQEKSEYITEKIFNCMANLLKIKQLLNEKNLHVKDLLDMVGISRQSLSDIYKNNSTKIDTLEKICRALQVHPAVFFEDEFGQAAQINSGNGNGHRLNGNGMIIGDVSTNSAELLHLQQENEQLKAQVEQLNEEVKKWQGYYINITQPK